MSRASITKAHTKIQELSWDPTFVSPVEKYATDYTFEKAPKKDPLKQVLRSYFPMEEEKDNRVFGAMDGAIRGNMFRQVQERWMEWQKLFLSIIPFPEISAARAMPLTIGCVPNPSIHNGLAIQMIDEVRHSTIQMNLKRLYMNHYVDPAGFDITEKAFSNCYAGTIGRQFGEGFITGDAITAANVYLTIVAETAFTNVLFVAMPGEAAANGDYLLPTVFHSVQSDECRHISNGYSIILMALADERNRQLLERDLRYAWWNNHAVVDAAIGTFIEYGTKDRRKDRESYAEMWRRWIYDDYYRSYLVPLEKYGLAIPHDLVEESWNRIWNKGYVHEVAQFFATGWFANYWRIDGMDDDRLRVVRAQVPGLVRQVRQVVGALLGVLRAQRPQADRVRAGRRVRVPAPLLELHGPVPDPRGHGRVDEVDGQRPHVLLGDLPLDRHGRVPPGVRGPPDAGHGPAHRQARVGDALPRHGRRRDHAGARLRPRRRQDARPAAAPEPRPEEDVDAGRGARQHAPEPEHPAQRDGRRRPRGVRRQVQARRPRRPAGGRVGDRRAEPDRCRWATSTRSGSSPSASSSRSTRTRPSSHGAFRQGLQLMHGCKEGQCSACKSFLLDGEVDLDRYSTFALPDFEARGGLDAAVPRPRPRATSRSS